MASPTLLREEYSWAVSWENPPKDLCCCHTKTRIGERSPTNPSIGVTPTKNFSYNKCREEWFGVKKTPLCTLCRFFLYDWLRHYRHTRYATHTRTRHMKLLFTLVKLVWSCSLQSVPELGAISLCGSKVKVRFPMAWLSCDIPAWVI